MSEKDFEVKLNDDGKIIDFLSSKELEPTPEEFIRQKFIRILHFEYGYNENVLAREVPIYYGNKELADKEGQPIRADIVVYNNKQAATSRNQGQIFFIVECKAPNVETGYNQLVSYIFNTSASGGVWFNDSTEGEGIKYYRRLFEPDNKLIPWPGIPRPKEAWDSIGRRKKDDLTRPKNIKGLLRRCHNKLHARGVESEEEDLTMDMVRLFLAKAQDEERPGEDTSFYCMPEEYSTEEGQEIVAHRIQQLFDEVKALNAEVFSEHERITVGARAICDVVIELQPFQLLSNINDAQQWDLMGSAYEEYTASYLKKKRGQFFTNRLVIDLMVAILDPTYTDVFLDPAGGSGGFLTSVIRYVRKKILTSPGSTVSKQRQLDRLRTRIFMIEISKRLVKVAKTSMILNGDGHAGMTQGDSLGSYDKLNDTILAQCSRGVPSIILTNPPFAGTGEGRITQTEILDDFFVAKKWSGIGDDFESYDEVLFDGTPPEMLFFERCLDWLQPGGRLGIVMPKSFLDTRTYYPSRRLLFEKGKLLGVVVCHKNTFQPHTGVRTCLVFVEKNKEDEPSPDDYNIFCAISRKIGQDSEGEPIYKIDQNNKPTDELDEDLSDILKEYKQFKEGDLVPSEYIFSIKKSNIGESLKFNPQLFLPKLNESLRDVEQIDLVNGWSIFSLSQIEQGIQIFKGPRLRTEPLIKESKENETTEPYYIPSSVLQEKSESFKWIDLSLASKNQRKSIEMCRVHKGDIVLTRSGSIGRVVYIGSRHDGAIASDDLIRVIINEEKLRLFVYYFLQSKFAQDQLLMNEYGAVQQHLEPIHVANLQIPIPDEWEMIDDLLLQIKAVLELREQLYYMSNKIDTAFNTKIANLITEGKMSSEENGENILFMPASPMIKEYGYGNERERHRQR